jgi:hypothetical protein
MESDETTLGFATFVVYGPSYGLQVHCRGNVTREMGLAQIDFEVPFLRNFLSGYNLVVNARVAIVDVGLLRVYDARSCYYISWERLSEASRPSTFWSLQIYSYHEQLL